MHDSTLETLELTDQNNTTKEEGRIGTSDLLKCIDSAIEAFKASRLRSMRDIVIPDHIRVILIEDELYTIGKRRVVWMEPMKSGRYSQNRFYICEVFDSVGKMRQLSLDRSDGSVVLLRSRLLGTTRGVRSVGAQPYRGD